MKPYLIILFLIVFSRLAFAETPEPGVLLETESSTPSIPITKSPSKPEKREPYRVFFPVDRFQNVVGNEIYIPMELLQLLSRNIKETGAEPLHRWNIERAEYQGSLIRNPLTQEIELSDGFKAVFDIVLEAENATIILPPLPVFQNLVFWDSKPIQPIWRAAEGTSGTGMLAFNIENEQKGKHRLELLLAPKPEERDKIRRISFSVPKIPNAVLHLRTPQDAPPITVTECFGAVTPNTLISPNLTAEIGPSDKLAFSWSNELGRSDSTTADVEQFFWLWAKPTQVEIRAFFRFRIEGGRIRQLNLLTDPRWHRSGQFHCEEYPIDQTETYLDSMGSDGLPSSENEITRLDFKTPVSGILTISAGFVLRDFNGIGKIRLPQFRALKSRITKLMLAISAEPVMELDYPAVGLGTGFESAWPGETFEEHPLAEYDLTKSDPSWMLAIRTKNQTPSVKMNQSIRFDDGDSLLHCLGEFSTAGEVFLQRFSVPDSFCVESVEVRDAKQNLVDIRLAENSSSKSRGSKFPNVLNSQSIRGQAPPSLEMREHVVFFKRSVTGNYSITVQGHFVTETKNKVQQLPLIIFDGVRTEEQLLNVFRTSAVVAEVKTDETSWSESEVAPIVPKKLPDSLPIRSWRRKGSETAPSQNPTFSLLPNNPIIQGEQITTLSKIAADSWNVSFDVLWDISNGELDTIRFHWDEQCGSVISVEPAVPFALEQTDGNSDLVFAQKAPFAGKRHFRIKTTLNSSETSVSVPKLIPILDKAEKIEIKNYVVLPQNTGGEPISWNLNRLESVDEATGKELEKKITGPLENGKPPIPGSLLTVSSDGILTPIDSGTVSNGESRLFFRTAGTDDFSATIMHKKSASVANLYDIHFFIKSDGGVFGNVTIDLKSRGQDSFLLRMPHGYELIRVACSGIASKGTRLTKDLWKIDLWSSDYPQRIKIVFRGLLTSESAEHSNNETAVTPIPLSRLSKEKVLTSLRFPMLAGISVQQTLWTISFETRRGDVFPPFDITASYENQTITPPAEELGKNSISLGQHVPTLGIQAMQTMLKLNLIRLDNLLGILNSVSVSTKSEEVKRWFDHWTNEWFSHVNRVDFQTANLPATLSVNEHLLLLDPSEKTLDNSAAGFIGTILESKNLPVFIEALMQRYQTSASGKFSLTDQPVNRRKPQFLFENSPVPWRDRIMENASHFFGVSEAPIREICLESNPPGYRLPFFLRNHQLNRSLLWSAIAICLLALSTQFHFWEQFIQFPHFWGMVVGLLLWSLFPAGIFGIAILLMTAFSFFHPAWQRNHEIMEPNPPR